MEDRSYGSVGGRDGPSRPWWVGPLLGIVATGAGLAAAEVLVGLLEGASSPVIAVGQKVIDLVPVGLKNWAIETFGTDDKTVLVATTLAIVFLAGIAMGGLAAEGRRVAASVGTAVIGGLGVASVLTRPDPSAAKIVPIVVGTLVSTAVLWWLAPPAPRAARVAPPGQAVATVGDSPVFEPAPVIPGTGVAARRTFLLRGVGVASVAAIAGGFGRLLQNRFSVADERATVRLPTVGDAAGALPPNADFDVEGLSPFVTRNDDFYRIDTALTVPQVSKEDWRLRIHGMVEHELELTFDDLLAREQVSEYVTLSCVSNPTGGPYVGNALWQGVRLDAILAEVGVDPESTQLVSRSADGWTCGTPVSSLVDGRNAMLAIGMNGEPLPDEHGYPVRMVVPGEYGYVSATKWVVDMEFTTWDAYDAYWVPRGWAQQAPMKMMTRIETPRRGSDVAAGTVAIAGTAWAVHKGISAVELRIDGGDWVRATLGGVPSPDTWRKWVYHWTAEPGEHRIEARAIDGLGEVQTDEIADVAPDGASGYHVVDVDVA
jgi:DMSO/TMAO reductase YedYZ molybdopterin-dependent catalytic subunit